VVKGFVFMPGKVAKIGTFSEWVGMFNDWRKEIGVNHGEMPISLRHSYGAIETKTSNSALQRPPQMGKPPPGPHPGKCATL